LRDQHQNLLILPSTSTKFQAPNHKQISMTKIQNERQLVWIIGIVFCALFGIWSRAIAIGIWNFSVTIPATTAIGPNTSLSCRSPTPTGFPSLILATRTTEWPDGRKGVIHDLSPKSFRLILLFSKASRIPGPLSCPPYRQSSSPPRPGSPCTTPAVRMRRRSRDIGADFLGIRSTRVALAGKFSTK
jgi:hypothetical protein